VQALTYSGTLTDSNGVALTGTNNLQVSLYDKVGSDGTLQCSAGPRAVALNVGFRVVSDAASSVFNSRHILTECTCGPNEVAVGGGAFGVAPRFSGPAPTTTARASSAVARRPSARASRPEQRARRSDEPAPPGEISGVPGEIAGRARRASRLRRFVRK